MTSVIVSRSAKWSSKKKIMITQNWKEWMFCCEIISTSKQDLTFDANRIKNIPIG